MISIDEAQVMLDEIAGELPPEFFKRLNGGIALLPDVKRSPYAVNDDLYIMGEYHVSRHLGRMIRIYYGSFIRTFGHLSREAAYEQLKNILLHEFTHHLESQAGENALVKKDIEFINKYRRWHEKP